CQFPVIAEPDQQPGEHRAHDNKIRENRHSHRYLQREIQREDRGDVPVRTLKRAVEKESQAAEPFRKSDFDEALEPVRHSDWKPFALSIGLATGPPRNWMSNFASATTLLELPIPAVKTVVLANSPGSGPNNSAPSTGTISEPCLRRSRLHLWLRSRRLEHQIPEWS